jgi:hypothetical protein
MEAVGIRRIKSIALLFRVVFISQMKLPSETKLPCKIPTDLNSVIATAIKLRGFFDKISNHEMISKSLF